MKELLLCLKELMKDYKNEIKGKWQLLYINTLIILLLEILSGDPQLAEEIEFDMRKFDEEMKRQEVATVRRHSIPASCGGRLITSTAVTPLGQLVSIYSGTS